MADAKAKGIDAAPAPEESQPDQAVQEAVEESSKEEQPETAAETGSEPEKTDSEEPKGDLRVALKEERAKRQALEQALADPNTIYQRAVELGLAAPGEEQEAPSSPSASPAANVPALVKFSLAMEKAQEKYPALKDNEDDQLAVSALIRKYGDPVKAADLYYSKLNQAKEAGKTEGALQREQEVTEKERAQTASSQSDVTSDAAELAELQEQARSLDRKVQEQALQKLLERRNKELGIV